MPHFNGKLMKDCIKTHKLKSLFNMDFLFVSRRRAIMNNVRVGGGVRSTLLIEALSRLGHVDVISFDKDPVESTFPACNVIFSGEPPKSDFTRKDWLHLNLNLLFAPWSPKGYYFVNKEEESIISHYYNEKHYDYVVCHFLYDAIRCGLTKYADKLIVDVDDNLVSLAKRHYANTPIRPLISWIRVFWKAIMIGMMQHRLLRRVKLSFYSNPSEAPYKKSVLLHNVPLLSRPCSDVSENTPMRILFVGNIDFSPNKKGILHFVEFIFPIIKEKIPTVELNVVGLCEDQSTRLKLCSVKGVNVLGFVDYLRDEYQNCRAVIVPLYQGAGTSIKFIEAVMMNRPIISTQMGARGFNSAFQANKHYLLANNDQEFADRVVCALSSLDKANVMAHNAYEIGKSHFSKNSFFDVVKRSVDAILEHQTSINKVCHQ